MSDQQQNRFQVDLRGLIDLLSQHLYSGPEVFVRELLQNAVDAIRARQQLDLGHVGTIEIEVVESRSGPPTLVFQDDGVGLSEQEVHQFLATIGQSSKRGNVARRPDDFLGQFGIGLLSSFMVTNQISVLTRSAREGDHPAVEWRGNTDGTYSVRPLKREIPCGTQVFLQPAEGFEEFFEPQRILNLARNFGEFLEPRIVLNSGGQTQVVNGDAPWAEWPVDPDEREQLLDYGRTTFERDFLDVIPLRSTAGSVTGVAYVLAQAVHAGARQRHRVYLKDMLLSNEAHDLLPEWAFFVQCVLNARGLRPTASRESFYKDRVLEDTQEELGGCLRRYLVEMARTQPNRFKQLIAVHHLAAKALAIDDDECLELFADWFPFETSLGTMTLGEYRQQHPVVRYVASRDQFRQIAQVAASESLAVVNAGYVYEVEILQRLGAIRPDIRVEPFDADQLSERFEELTQQEREETIEFERLADVTLQRFKCAVEIAKFHPTELPALYVADENSGFMRSIEQAQDVTEGVWTDVLGSLAQDVPSTYARLYLNYGNPLIHRICHLADERGQQRSIEMVYVQSLLLGHFPLKQSEIKLLNEGLLGLIDWAVTTDRGHE
ncbi:HSP90 family protein [Aeoliella sp. ICT_H6.2]|uniref:HSP90 family protein n=1 Tax=Aeoliella straminimaris TaxID=2954799 RepID=A0A9X2F5J3_9BACT|nr:HSP90 family protein [Aeoliella straminimaris]MCO6042555.1 HSP90 family protein [Aeoliella straminimaris]